jgi:hypothetical protein
VTLVVGGGGGGKDGGGVIVGVVAEVEATVVDTDIIEDSA